MILIVYLIVAVLVWAPMAIALIQFQVGEDAAEPSDMVFGAFVGFLTAVLWPVTVPAAAMGFVLWKLYRRVHPATEQRP